MAQLMLVNPKRRKRKTATKRKTSAKRTVAKRRYRRNPIGLAANPIKKRRRYRRNPIRLGGKGLLAPMMPAAISATGAIALDLAWGVIGSKLPDNLGTGPLRHVAKAFGAIGLGMLAGMVTKKDTANQLVTGALTVVMHSAMKETIQKSMPKVTLGEADEFSMNGLAEYMTDSSMSGLGEYMTGDDMGAIGYSGGGEYFDADLGGLGIGEDENVFSL